MEIISDSKDWNILSYRIEGSRKHEKYKLRAHWIETCAELSSSILPNALENTLTYCYELHADMTEMTRIFAGIIFIKSI